MFKINSFWQGTVGPASWGHIVKVHYQILVLNNSTIDEQIKTFTLGSRVIIPGLDSIIVGMKVGETRQAIVPPKYAYLNAKDGILNSGINPESYYKVNVTLQEIIPHSFAKEDEVKIFDAKITKLSSGDIVYNSVAGGAKISMNIGDLRYPMILLTHYMEKSP